MQNMDNSIADLYTKGYIDREEAVARANNPGKLDKILAPMPESQSKRGKKQVEQFEAARS
jgi:hypothetical protein